MLYLHRFYNMFMTFQPDRKMIWISWAEITWVVAGFKWCTDQVAVLESNDINIVWRALRMKLPTHNRILGGGSNVRKDIERPPPISGCTSVFQLSAIEDKLAGPIEHHSQVSDPTVGSSGVVKKRTIHIGFNACGTRLNFSHRTAVSLQKNNTSITYTCFF
jgi:hypothetical protein